MGNRVKTLTIDYNGGKPKFKPKAGKTDLQTDDFITLQLSGFPGGTQINEVDFFNNKRHHGDDKKDESSPVGEWTRQAGKTSGLTEYDLTTHTDGTVDIIDIEDPTEDEKFWFSVSMGDGTTTWSVDPELINKKKP